MPGAGSTKGANWFQEQNHVDGTTMFGSSGLLRLGDPRVRYEYKDWILLWPQELVGLRI